MTDLDTLLPDRLRLLADEHAPSRDPLAQAASARARYRLQRRTRMAATGIMAAVAAIAVGVPVTFQALATASGHGVAATPTTSAPSTVTEEATSASETAAPTTAQSPTAEESAAESALAKARSAAELTQAVGLMEPLAFEIAPLETRCDRLDQGQLQHLLPLDGVLAPAEGETAIGSVSGCRFDTIAYSGTTSAPGLELSLGYLPATSVAATLSMTDPDSRCATADLRSTPAGAVLQRCTTDGGAAQWWVHAPVATGATYVLGVTVGDRWTGISGPEAVARFAGFLSRNW